MEKPLEKTSIDIQGSLNQPGFFRPSIGVNRNSIDRTSVHRKGGHPVIDKNGESLDKDPSISYDDDGHVMRTGGFITASANIITAVIGAGVLSLAWCTAQVGWAAGPIMQLIFASITLYCSLLLCDCYRYPDPVSGERNYTYTMAVRRYLGQRYVLFCGVIQYLNLVSTSVGYTVTSGLAMVAVFRAHCYRYNPESRYCYQGTSDDPNCVDQCHPAINKYMIIFGAIQLLFTQVPNLEEIWWLSIVAAIMSFLYSCIGLGLSIGKSTEPQSVHSHGTIKGLPISGPDGIGQAQKVWNFMLALGNVAFAYSYSFILIEIADTLRGPKENVALKKASVVSIGVTSFFYLSIGTIGYSAFGNAAPGNLLTGFGFFEPWWLIIMANLAIVIHLIGGYQVWTQPFLMMVESNVERMFPNSSLLQAGFNLPVGKGKVWRVRWYILIWRSVYVVFTTIIACLAPFFNDIVGIMGSLGFWPLTVFLPISMHIVQRQIPKWSTKWILLHSLSTFCFFISVAAMIGSIAGIYEDTRNYRVWHANY